MAESLVLSTENPDIILRELSTGADDVAYYEAYNASRSEIERFDPDADTKHQTLEDTRQARLNAGDKIRMGIWDHDTLVGSANLTPHGQAVEVGYWLDSRHTGHGYATLATKSLGAYAKERYTKVYAEVVDDNAASARVLERSGFRQTAREAGRLVFELSDALSDGQKISLADTDRFDREGFSGNVYVASGGDKGFSALLVDVHGRHPKKRILEGNTRSYFVVDGGGVFTLNGTRHQVAKGDLFIIPNGSTYEYESGEAGMQLFEFNVSPDGTFGDQKLE